MPSYEPRGGTRQPIDFQHELKYAIAGAPLAAPVAVAERVIPLPPGLRAYYNQGTNNSCAGSSVSEGMSIYNSGKRGLRRYDDEWLWHQAKVIDPWPDTVPGDNEGTALRSVLDVLRTEGHRHVYANGTTRAPNEREGIVENRWCATVDEARAVLARGEPIFAASPYPDGLMRPVLKNGERFADETKLGGGFGHAYLLTAVSDERQAFYSPGTWGDGYDIWIPYRVIEEFRRGGWMELGAVIDRPPTKARRSRGAEAEAS